MITRKEFEDWKKIIGEYLHWKRKVIRNKLYEHERTIRDEIKKFSFLETSTNYVNFKSPYFQFKLLDKSGVMLDIGGEGFEKTGEQTIKYCLSPLIENNKEKKYIRGVGEFIPFENEIFDFVIMKDALEYVISPKMVLREINRVLKIDGKFYLTAIVEGSNLNNFVDGVLTYDKIHSLLGEYFDCEVEFYNYLCRFSYCGSKRNGLNIKKEVMPEFLYNFLEKEIPNMKKTFTNVNFQQ